MPTLFIIDDPISDHAPSLAADWLPPSGIAGTCYHSHDLIGDLLAKFDVSITGKNITEKSVIITEKNKFSVIQK